MTKMAAGRTLRSLVSRRRRADDDGEDEEGPVVVEDSQSEGSLLSEPDDDEGDGSSVGHAGEADAAAVGAAQTKPEASSNESRQPKPRKPKKRTNKKSRDDAGVEPPPSQSNFRAMADTEAMMNGLNVSQETQAQEEPVDFETMGSNGATAVNPTAANGNANASTLTERQRREHEEYKKKRDSNPAFIPNRGNFFMHDTRGQNGQGPPPRNVWQGRGRGRGGTNVGGPFSPANQMAQAERAAEQPWKHDLHDTINEEPQPQAAREEPKIDSTRLFPKPAEAPSQSQQPSTSFSSTTLIGTVQIRVFLPGWKTPTAFSEVPWKQYVRLPDHRPPLRRDKPVRVFVPGHAQRYIFPAMDRSFIFIPRQMRPNQQGFNRGQHQRSIGGYGYSSRRTSMYGGSIYSGSVAPSRRSSLAGISREQAFSPVGSFAGMPSGRPVVRLPRGPQHTPEHFVGWVTPNLSGHQTPVNMQIHTYPLPQQPAQFGTPTTTMHQPRPQKTISVTGIESPILQQEPQPFQNQLPYHITAQPPPYFSPQQPQPFPQPQPLPQTGTPLSGIPEQAVHAPAFQPPGYAQPQFYSQYPPQQNYFYPPHGANGYSQMPMYMAPPQQRYSMPQPPPAMSAPPHPPPQSNHQSQPSGEQQSQQSQSGMVAHESNGMVFYVPASEAQQSEQYQPAESFVPQYAMPGLPPPTPAPDNSLYYYPAPPPQPGIQDLGSAYWYPPPPQQ